MTFRSATDQVIAPPPAGAPDGAGAVPTFRSGGAVASGPAPAATDHSFFGDVGEAVSNAWNNVVDRQNDDARLAGKLKSGDIVGAMAYKAQEPIRQAGAALGLAFSPVTGAFNYAGDKIYEGGARGYHLPSSQEIAASPELTALDSQTHAAFSAYQAKRTPQTEAALDSAREAYTAAVKRIQGAAPEQRDSIREQANQIGNAVLSIDGSIPEGGAAKAAESVAATTPEMAAMRASQMRARATPIPPPVVRIPRPTTPSPAVEALYRQAEVEQAAAMAGTGSHNKANALLSQAIEAENAEAAAPGPAASQTPVAASPAAPGKPATVPGAVSAAPPASPPVPATAADLISMDPATRKALKRGFLAEAKNLGGLDAVKARLSAAPAEATTAEALGPVTETRLKGFANDSTLSVPQTVEDLVNQRIAALPDKVRRAAERSFKVSPEEAKGGIREFQGRAQGEAKPLYEDLNDNSGIIDSPRLRVILGLPEVKRSLPKAIEIVRGLEKPTFHTIEEPHIPDALPTGRVGASKQQALGYLPDVKEAMQAGSGKVAARRSVRVHGPTLNEWIAARGGIRDTGGDLAQLGANAKTYNKGLGKLGKIIRPDGHGLDDTARAAHDAGYFFDEPSPNQFVEAIDRELSGRSVKLPMGSNGNAARVRYLEGLQERADRLGVGGGAKPAEVASALANDDAEQQSILDQMNGDHQTFIPEMKQVDVPTMEVLDNLKKVLDGKIEAMIAHPDKFSAAEVITAQHQRAELVKELDQLNPKYVAAREVGGMSPKVGAAAKMGQRLFSEATTNDEFHQLVGPKSGMGPGGLSVMERRAILADYLDRMNTRLGKPESGKFEGNVSLKFLLSPNGRQRLAYLVGPDAAGSFLSEVERLENLRASGLRLLPGQGSQTQPLAAVAKDTNDKLHGIGNALAESGSVNPFKIADETVKGVAKTFVRTQMHDFSIPIREAWARILIQDPKETLALIKAFEDTPAARRRAFVESMLGKRNRALGATTSTSAALAPGRPSATAPALGATAAAKQPPALKP